MRKSPKIQKNIDCGPKWIQQTCLEGEKKILSDPQKEGYLLLFIEQGRSDWCALTVGNAWFRGPIFEHGVRSPCTLMSHGHNQVAELFILLILKNWYCHMMQTSSTQEEKVSFSEALKWPLTADFLSRACYQVVVLLQMGIWTLVTFRFLWLLFLC